MGLYTGDPLIWANDIYQFEETDPVQGGPGGVDNVPLKQLADRTAWLKDNLPLMGLLPYQLEVAGAGTYNVTAAQAGTFFTVRATGIYNFNLPNAATVKHGAIFPFASFCNPGCVVNIIAPVGQNIYDTDEVTNVVSMHHKEQLFLVAYSDHWKIMYARGNFYCAGEEVKARKALTNTLVMQGQLLQRAQYPRLWKWVKNSLTNGQELVPEYLWFYDDRTYRGCFTDGDGVSTFRIPDERGMFDRMLDLGRGIDINRVHNYAGGYEPDMVGKHGHLIRNGWGGSSTNPLNNPNSGFSGQDNLGEWLGSETADSLWLKATGGNETTVKSIGKLNLLKY